ncbi:protein-disulfide reductase DsbD family protein [Wenzhouxiangella sp. EGI_FJ10409]|uniref:protein-disulfide reductase DsbD family protein n=1 Tax=Wenzhouxiangella sp. EGI_FJ10409 TaxID=3243767 RepID=UPI0035E2B0A9
MAVAAQPGPVQRPHIEVELVSEVDHVEPGQPFRVGLRMLPDAHWHTYWKNPGDSGLTTEFEWTLPDGASASPIEWPWPERVPMGHLVNYGYGGEHLLPVTITPPADLRAGGSFPIDLAADWLVCEEICIPGDAELSMTLPVRAGPAPKNGQVAGLFDWADDRRPQKVDWPARFDTTGGQLAVQIESVDLPAGDDWTVFVGAENIVDHAQPAETARFEGVLQAGQPLSPYLGELPESLPVVFVDETNDRAFEVLAEPGSLQSTGAAAQGAGEPPVGWGAALLLALAGGVLLNLMPCVFPVLSIKAMSFVAGAGHDQRAHGLAYTAGVVLSFAALAGVLLGLRATGEAVGWGFQLQSPWVVGILVYVLFALALSLSGLFTFGGRLMGAGQQLTEREGVSGSFFTGVLACVVASPCTAPFMGVALGAAVLMPWPLAMSIFIALGFGLALPMLVLSFSPALARRLPKPGPWMTRFKQLMAFPLYLAVVWLLWVLARQVGADGLAAVLTGLVVLAFVLWLGGLRDRGSTTASVRHVALVLGTVAAIAALGAGVRMQASSAGGPEDAWWEDYSAERLSALRADPERAVLVNMTADWCVTCLVNERVALGTDRVRAALTDNDVVYMKGDWTRRDEAITEYLSEFDRNGVPLYVLYPHDGGDPKVLPQVLSPGLLVNAIESL